MSNAKKYHAMDDGKGIKSSFNLAQLSRLRVAFQTLPLFHLRTEILRAYARKNYATVEIDPKTVEF